MSADKPKLTRSRVKVYELDQDSQWVDKGTGHVEIVHVEVTFVSFQVSMRDAIW
jgi:hypothetical protein